MPWRKGGPGAVGAARLPMAGPMVDANVGFTTVLGGAEHASLHDWRVTPSQRYWRHLQLTHETETWLLNYGGMDPVAFRALVAMGARPRCAPFDDGVLVVLRGVNTNDSAAPEDMVSVRMWIEPGRVVTVAPRNVSAVGDLRRRLEAGRGPTSPGELIVDLAGRMLDRMTPILGELDEETDLLTERLVDEDLVGFRAELTSLRRRLIQYRRHLAPQRDALRALLRESRLEFEERDREVLREVAERTQKHVEDVSALAERAAVMHDELESRLGERMNRNMQTMSLAAVMFLPMSFLTSLLGSNVGGIPGADSPYGFTIVCVTLGLVFFGQLFALRRTRYFRQI